MLLDFLVFHIFSEESVALLLVCHRSPEMIAELDYAADTGSHDSRFALNGSISSHRL